MTAFGNVWILKEKKRNLRVFGQVERLLGRGGLNNEF
jgi:hypothetical protein